MKSLFTFCFSVFLAILGSGWTLAMLEPTIFSKVFYEFGAFIVELFSSQFLLFAITPFVKLKLEKDMYKEAENKNLTFTEFLETQDTSENYTDTKLDAFERQLAVNEVRTKGKNVSLVEDFYKTSDNKILFPEFINRNLLIGLNHGKSEATISDVISTTTSVDARPYKGIYADIDNSDLQYKRVSEGATFPRVMLKTKDKEVTLQKIGYRFDATYETVKNMRVNLFANMIQLMGFHLGRKMVNEALLTLLNGDGNSNPALPVPVASSGTVTFADLLDLQMAFTNHESEMLIGNKATVKKLLLISEFRDPIIGAKFLTEGSFTTPFGNVIKVNPLFPDNKVLAFNKKAGIEMLEMKSMSLVESDKIIEQQIEKTVFSKMVGFSKIFSDSACVLNIV